MLSVEQCKRFLRDYELSDEEVVQLRDSLSQLAIVLVDQYMSNRALGSTKNSNERSTDS